MENLLTTQPKIGVFLEEYPDHFVQSSSSLVMKLDDRKLDKQTRVLQLSVKNEGDEIVHVNSFMVGEFEICKDHVCEVLENGWGQSSFSGYKPLRGYTRESKFAFKRDQNPYSFRKNYGYLDESTVNEWYTQLVKSNNAVVVGAITTKNQYVQIYLKTVGNKLIIRITSQYDGLQLKPGQTISSEKIVIISGTVNSSLEKFSQLLKEENKIVETPKPPTGLCCAYYYQGNKVDEQYVLEQLATVDKIPGKLELEYVQIDAGYCLWGDWNDVKKQFPSGMDFMVKEIKKRGMKAGIWIAPFVASPNSKLFQEHNNWFLKDDVGKDFEARFTSPFDFIPALQLRVLDATRPEVQDYITRIIKQFVDWGFEFIKTDFTYPVGFCRNYYQQMTRAQAIRLGFETIRKAAGEKIHLMSGITQLSPLVGLIDSVRVGLDTVNPFVFGIPVVDKLVNNWMLTQNLRNCEARQFFNGKIWVNDADCLVCNQHSGLSRDLLDKHFRFLSSYNGSRWVGDHLGKIPWNRYEDYILKLFGFIPSKSSVCL